MAHSITTSRLQVGLIATGFASLLVCAGVSARLSPKTQKVPLSVASTDFTKTVRPFLTRYCISCHQGKRASAGLNLEPYLDFASLSGNRKGWHTLLQNVVSGVMPPSHEHSQPSTAQRSQFTSLVSQILERQDRQSPPNPGRVTLRRLNRIEYRNTIHDLIGVDYDPETSFPSDDVGYGFDNIGDVLTLSPVLMERYLGASEEIMAQAIKPIPPPVPVRRNGSIYIEPSSDPNRWTGGWRWMLTDATSPIETGPLSVTYQWEPEGEYVFKTRVYGHSADSQPIRVALIVGGSNLADPSPSSELAKFAGNIKEARILKTFTITARKREDAESLEVHIPPMEGRKTTLLALEKPAVGAPPIQLWAEHLTLEGPLETRPATHFRLLATRAKSLNEKTQEVLERFLTRAFRRPPTLQEVATSTHLVESIMAKGENWEAGIQFAMQAALCSPKFLFRVEQDANPKSTLIQQLDEFQLASRLSYFLWSSMPDDELLELAKRGQLTANLTSQVRRMLLSPKSSALVNNFAMQWLQLRRMAIAAPDKHLFPDFDNKTRAALLKETELFVDSVFRENRSILELIDANYTFLNENLAKRYGILYTDNRPTQTGEPQGERIRGEKFQRVILADHTRGGILTLGSVLTVTSNPTRTSPVKRGKWVLEQILGEPPPPPPSVQELSEKAEDTASASLRKRMEIHRRNPVCANCHAKMDALGFALENFDAVGTYRTKDGTFSIDATGQTPDGSHFTGAGELKAFILKRKEDFVRCLTEKLMIYALGRGLESYDRPAVERITRTLKTNDYRFAALVTEIVKSDPFRKRRGR